MKQLALLILPLTILSCTKSDFDDELIYSNVWLNSFHVNLIPFDHDGESWDPNGWTSSYENPDVYVIIRNRQGMIYEVTSNHWDVHQTDLPLSFNWLDLQPTPDYRDELVFEFWDHESNSDDDEYMGQASVFPFELQIENDMADLNIQGDGFIVTGQLYFTQ